MRITFTGDILVEKEQLHVIGEGDYRAIFSPLKDMFSKSDIIVGNLETPIAGKDLGYTDHKWCFNTPENLLDALKDSGFNILTTANNHCLDRGVEGLKRTIRNLDKYEFQHTGTRLSNKDKNYCSIETPQGKIALMSYTYGTNASFNKNYLTKSERKLVNLFQPQEKSYRPISRFNIPLRAINKLRRTYGFRFNNYFPDLKKEIKKVKLSGAETIIMCLHIGGQYMPTPINHTRHVVKWLLKNGVDIVIGNHEHVIHPMEWVNNKFVAYCLGNLTATPESESASMIDLARINKTDYNIILHLDINADYAIPIISFQIAKIVTGGDGISRTFLLYDLIMRENDSNKRKELINDNNWIVRKVIGNNARNISLRQEYKLPFK